MSNIKDIITNCIESIPGSPEMMDQRQASGEPTRADPVGAQPIRTHQGRPGDSNTRLICELAKGFTLWRCINRAGCEYSYITDRAGVEIMSAEARRELRMIRAFSQYYL